MRRRSIQDVAAGARWPLDVEATRPLRTDGHAFGCHRGGGGQASSVGVGHPARALDNSAAVGLVPRGHACAKLRGARERNHVHEQVKLADEACVSARGPCAGGKGVQLLGGTKVGGEPV